MPPRCGGAWRRGSGTRNLRSMARVATLPGRGRGADVPGPPDHRRGRDVRARADRDAGAPEPARPVPRRLRGVAVDATERAAVRRHLSRLAPDAAPRRAPRAAAAPLAHHHAMAPAPERAA